MTEFEKEIALIETMGLKTSPLRLEYERKVCELGSISEKLRAEGFSDDQIARAMHEKRRELGRQYKEAASRPIDDLDNRLTRDGFQQWYMTHKDRMSS